MLLRFEDEWTDWIKTVTQWQQALTKVSKLIINEVDTINETSEMEASCSSYEPAPEAANLNSFDIVYGKKSFLSTESDTKISQSIYFAYKVGIISS